jgi:hypothetical protein
MRLVMSIFNFFTMLITLLIHIYVTALLFILIVRIIKFLFLINVKKVCVFLEKNDFNKNYLFI